MNLIETTVLTSADFPIAELKDYLRLGSGFTDDDVQDGLLETCLRAAMGAIEARTTKVLIERAFEYKFYSYREGCGGMLMPISPLIYLNQFIMYDKMGNSTDHSKNDFQLMTDSQRPRMIAKAGDLPEIPELGWGLLRFLAGHGAWDTVPRNLQLAMLMLAASYYENRDVVVSGRAQMPLTVAALLEPYQRVRLGMGA